MRTKNNQKFYSAAMYSVWKRLESCFQATGWDESIPEDLQFIPNPIGEKQMPIMKWIRFPTL